jgi:hypothetical protein
MQIDWEKKPKQTHAGQTLRAWANGVCIGWIAGSECGDLWYAVYGEPITDSGDLKTKAEAMAWVEAIAKSTGEN